MNPEKLRRFRGLPAAFVGLMLFGVSNASFATEQWVTDNVKYVYPQADGSFIISFVNPQPICTSSATPQYFNVAVGHNGMNADGVKAMLATVLTALAGGNQIQVAFEAATADCYVNRLRIVG